MKTILYLNKILLAVLLAGGMTMSCSDDAAINVYMPAANAVVNSTFDIADTVKFAASIVGADYPTVSTTSKSNISVTFKVDADKVKVFNDAMGTDYLIMPSANFTFDETGVIAQGSSTTSPLNLIIKDGDQLDAFSSYLLPISIEKVDGGAVGNTQQTTFFILTRSPALGNLPKFDRTAWTIKDKSTEEPGEGGGNGLAVDVLDGNWNSYWHSKWAGSEPPPPHTITIDMGGEAIVHGISLVDRNLKDWAHGQPKTVKVSTSTDGDTFTDVGSSYSLEMGTDPVQKEVRFFLSSFKSARYIRVTVTSIWGGGNSCSIAEIYAL